MKCDKLWRNARLATMTDPALGLVDAGVIACTNGTITYAGPAANAPAFDPAETIDCQGRWITPGLIDCHSHLVHGGSRAHEFELRLGGASYEEIARAGGGILSTVRATRAADEQALLAASARRLACLMNEGVTTVEIKSGYGLEVAAELRMLRVARELARRFPVRTLATLLGAHALPPEYAGRQDDYVALVADEMVPDAAREGLADAVDAFCEGIAFSPAQCQRVFEAARRAGLPVKLHADQLSDLGGAALAARFGALSADHLEYTGETGVAAMGAPLKVMV